MIANPVRLFHPFRQATVPFAQLSKNCTLFRNNQSQPTLYQIRSPVSLNGFFDFLTALTSDTLQITTSNVFELLLLSEEFGFQSLSARLSEFQVSTRLSFDFPTKPHFPNLPHSEFSLVVNGTTIAVSPAVSPAITFQLSVDACARTFIIPDGCLDHSATEAFTRFIFGGDVYISDADSLALLFKYLCNPELAALFLSVTDSPLPDSYSLDTLDAILTSKSLVIDSEDTLFYSILDLGPAYFPLLRHISWHFLSSEVFTSLQWNPIAECIWEGIHDFRSPSRTLKNPLDSLIITDFPEIFREFQEKKFTLLWRGTRDGFRLREFHYRCDEHPNTLVVVMDLNGNVFGGFTRCEWEPPVVSDDWFPQYDGDDHGWIFQKADPMNFLFTLKNPHNFPAKRFKPHPGRHGMGLVYCSREDGPCFGIEKYPGFDLCIGEGWICAPGFGTSYLNDTGLDGPTFFTGSLEFCQLKEIEVFEMTD
jgi:hypothetical protein